MSLCAPLNGDRFAQMTALASSSTGSALLVFQVLRHDLAKLVAVGDVEFDAGAVDVAFNGTNRDRQPVGDLPVR